MQLKVAFSPQHYLGSLKEIYRILKPNGFLLFGTPNSKSLRKLLFRPGQIGSTAHHREFSMDECRDLIQKAKFKIIYNRFNPYLDLIKKSPQSFLYYLIVRMIPRFQESIEILAVKR